MNRKQITQKLSDILVADRLSGIGKYWAKEVTLDYGTSHPIRVDYMQYTPDGAVYASDIENGYFTCYEIKSCKEDVYSGKGLNFVGEKNYIVTTMDCYKELLPDIESGKLQNYILQANGRFTQWDILVAIPGYNQPKDEIDNPTPFDTEGKWKLRAMRAVYQGKGYRVRSKVELLFCMLRAGK